MSTAVVPQTAISSSWRCFTMSRLRRAWAAKYNLSSLFPDRTTCQKNKRPFKRFQLYRTFVVRTEGGKLAVELVHCVQGLRPASTRKRKGREGMRILLTDVFCLLGILVVRQVVSWHKNGDSTAILQRQANLVELVPVLTPEDRQVNGVVGCDSAHE